MVVVVVVVEDDEEDPLVADTDVDEPVGLPRGVCREVGTLDVGEPDASVEVVEGTSGAGVEDEATTHHTTAPRPMIPAITTGTINAARSRNHADFSLNFI